MGWPRLAVMLLAGFSVIILSQKAYAQEQEEEKSTIVSSADKVSDEVLDKEDIKETEAKRNDLKEEETDGLPRQVQYKRRDIREIRQEAKEKGIDVKAQRKDIRTDQRKDIREFRQERKNKGQFIKGQGVNKQ